MKKIRSARSKEKTEKRVTVNFTPTEYAHFLTMKEESGVPSLSLFIKARIFNETFRVIKVDRSLLDYYQKLTTLYGQFRSVGVNYNQTVVAMKSNFTEKKAFAMLAKLEKLTLELAIIGGEIVQLTREFKRNGNIDSSHFTSYCSLLQKKSGFLLVWRSLIDYFNAITVF